MCVGLSIIQNVCWAVNHSVVVLGCQSFRMCVGLSITQWLCWAVNHSECVLGCQSFRMGVGLSIIQSMLGFSTAHSVSPPYKDGA